MPPITSMAPPTPIASGTSRSSICVAMNTSCRGCPNPTRRRCGRTARISAMTEAACSSVKYPCFPAICSCGYPFFNVFRAWSSDAGDAPNRNTRRSSSAAWAMSRSASSIPVILWATACPYHFDAMTIPTPSGVMKSACARTGSKWGVRRMFMTNSGPAVMIICGLSSARNETH